MAALMRNAVPLMLLLAGCASTSDVMNLGEGRYFVSAQLSGNPSWDEARKLAIDKAHAHCGEQQQGEAVIDDMKTRGARGWTPLTVDLRFHCAAKA